MTSAIDRGIGGPTRLGRPVGNVGGPGGQIGLWGGGRLVTSGRHEDSACYFGGRYNGACLLLYCPSPASCRLGASRTVSTPPDAGQTTPTHKRAAALPTARTGRENALPKRQWHDGCHCRPDSVLLNGSCSVRLRRKIPRRLAFRSALPAPAAAAVPTARAERRFTIAIWD